MHLHDKTVQESSSDCGKYFAYALKEKAAQNRVPDGFEHPGRFWGVWGFRPEWAGALLTQEEFVTLRRTFSKWQKSKGSTYRPKVRGRFSGSWYLTDDRSGFLVVAQLVRAVEGRDLLPLLT